MKEKNIERYLCEQVNRLGGFCIKLDPKNAVGIPDRLIIAQDVIIFVELKRATGGVLSNIQKYWRKKLLNFNHDWRLIDDKQKVDKLISEIKKNRAKSSV